MLVGLLVWRCLCEVFFSGWPIFALAGPSKGRWRELGWAAHASVEHGCDGEGRKSGRGIGKRVGTRRSGRGGDPPTPGGLGHAGIRAVFSGRSRGTVNRPAGKGPPCWQPVACGGRAPLVTETTRRNVPLLPQQIGDGPGHTPIPRLDLSRHGFGGVCGTRSRGRRLQPLDLYDHSEGRGFAVPWFHRQSSPFKLREGTFPFLVEGQKKMCGNLLTGVGGGSGQGVEIDCDAFASWGNTKALFATVRWCGGCIRLWTSPPFPKTMRLGRFFRGPMGRGGGGGLCPAWSTEGGPKIPQVVHGWLQVPPSPPRRPAAGRTHTAGNFPILSGLAERAQSRCGGEPLGVQLSPPNTRGKRGGRFFRVAAAQPGPGWPVNDRAPVFPQGVCGEWTKTQRGAGNVTGGGPLGAPWSAPSHKRTEEGVLGEYFSRPNSDTGGFG